MAKAVFFISVILLMIGSGHSRFVRENSSDRDYDGTDHVNQSSFDRIERLTSSVTCEPMYGFLPCTTDIWGQLFLIVVYEYLLFLGEKYISAGSELFFKNLGSGVFGASAFHILGSLPEAVIVLVSGLSGSKETAQSQVVVGMGMLAGSTIMLLTLIWGSCVAFGSYDFSKLDFKQTSRLSLTGSGVSTDLETSYTARIMVLTIIPFIIVQLAKIFNSASGVRVAIIVSLVITIVFLFLYCSYQIFKPSIQDRRLEYLMQKYVQNNLLEKLLTVDGNPNTHLIIEKLGKKRTAVDILDHKEGIGWV
ncbi:hypothetical protein HHK36_032281 [Tetracentron sinense]|uniref:Sodium/calcium exchanger membrane region domain-containing protein n=1 Tax=Tetracentron sinense TaxID=13715 RepID=A0A834Y9D4_TETSI|nr:hypothetical protein HHK36_032281 [Tetracentron sinense]